VDMTLNDDESSGFVDMKDCTVVPFGNAPR
jgi:hypothetical protein